MISCPQVFCVACKEKLIPEYGFEAFQNACPVCLNLCCCGSNKNIFCVRKIPTNHCYKKCLIYKKGIKINSMKSNSDNNLSIRIIDDGSIDSEDIKEHDREAEAKFIETITQIHFNISSDINIPISPITPNETLTIEAPLKKQKN